MKRFFHLPTLLKYSGVPLSLLIGIVVTLPVISMAIGYAPIRNFMRSAYEAGAQNWAMAQDEAGRLYFANRDGLLRFDGSRWRLFRLPNYTTVRCVLPHDGKFFVGGSGEFGYFATGKEDPVLRYSSLSASLTPSEKNFSEIWNVLKLTDSKLVFQGDYRLYFYDGKNTTAIPTPDKITSSAVINGRLYVALQSGKLCVVEDQKLMALPGCEALQSHKIVAILPFSNGRLLLATEFAGLYLYYNGTLSPFNTPISDFLKANQIFCAAKNGDNYAFGTVNKGAVIINFATGEIAFMNKETGMQNNTVLGLGFDFNDNLWLCLDNGIDYAMTQSPIKNLLGHNSEAGAGYSSLLRGNTLFLATNTGLYTTPFPITESPAPQSLTSVLKGQVWSIDTIAGSMFVSTDAGLYLNSPGGFTRMSGIPHGSWSVTPLKKYPGYALASTYKNFYLLHREGSGWSVVGPLANYSEAGGKFVEDNKGYIWIAHWIKGVYRLKPARDLKSFSEIKLYTSADGLPSERDNSVTSLNDRILITTASGEILAVDDSGKLKRDDNLSSLLNLHLPVHLHSVNEGDIMVLSPKVAWKLGRDVTGSRYLDTVSFRPVLNNLIPGFEHLGKIDADHSLLSHQDGFFCLDTKTESKSNWHNKVFVDAVIANGDSLLYLAAPDNKLQNLKVPYSLNSLTFEFAAPEFRDENGVLFSYFLEEYDSAWSTPSSQSSKEYTRLHEGKYTLHVKAYNPVTGRTSTTDWEFEILPPWYRSSIAKIIYGIIVIVIIIWGIRTLKKYSVRAAKKMEARKEKELEDLKREAEQEALRKDYEITALKGEQLEQDIKHKSSELSNITMNVIRKNEMLQNISAKLAKLQQQAADNSDRNLFREIDRIKALISENISHDDDWKRFHQNFDIVYADFTRKLLEKHPGLSQSEVRLCCYLKMGLASKEIAPLCNITPKSVEINRSRLRAKLGLERHQHLSGYLQNI